MLNFLIDNKFPVHQRIDLGSEDKVLVFKVPFDPQNRCMVTIYRIGRDKDESKYKLVVKGAPEVVMPLVSNYVDPQNN